MVTISSRESQTIYDIEERSFLFSVRLIKVLSELVIDTKYNSIVDQVLRSGTSIGANITEGRGGATRKEMRRYYKIAFKSSNETKYWLRLINESIVRKDALTELIKEVTELSRILSSSIAKLQDLPERKEK